MVWMIFMGVLAVIFAAMLYCLLVAASRADDAMEIDEEQFIIPETTPVPMPTKTWVRYDVPMDDDLQQYIEDVCKEYDVEPSVVMAIIKVESDCNPALVGDNGNSWGLMQIYSTQHTARCVRLGAWNLLDPKMNVKVGVDYLAELLNCGHGMEWALSWYNGHGGEPCDYALTVLHEAERLLESAMTVTTEVEE